MKAYCKDCEHFSTKHKDYRVNKGEILTFNYCDVSENIGENLIFAYKPACSGFERKDKHE